MRQVLGGGGGGRGRGFGGGGGRAVGGAEEAGRAERTTGRRRRVEVRRRWVTGGKIRWGRWAGGLFGLPWVFLFHSRPTSFLFFLFFLEYMVRYTYYIVPPSAFLNIDIHSYAISGWKRAFNNKNIRKIVRTLLLKSPVVYTFATLRKLVGRKHKHPVCIV